MTRTARNSPSHGRRCSERRRPRPGDGSRRWNVHGRAARHPVRPARAELLPDADRLVEIRRRRGRRLFRGGLQPSWNSLAPRRHRFRRQFCHAGGRLAGGCVLRRNSAGFRRRSMSATFPKSSSPPRPSHLCCPNSRRLRPLHGRGRKGPLPTASHGRGKTGVRSLRRTAGIARRRGAGSPQRPDAMLAQLDDTPTSIDPRLEFAVPAGVEAVDLVVRNNLERAGRRTSIASSSHQPRCRSAR